MKKKKIVILSAAIAVLLIAVIIVASVLWPTGESTGSSGKKQQIVVIKKKPSSSQAETEDSSEPTEDDSFYEDLTGDDSFGDDLTDEGSSNDASSDKTDDDTQSENTSSYEVDIEPYEISPVDKKIGYIMYHHHPGMWNARYADIYGEEKTFMNYFRVNTVEQAKQVKEWGGMAWLYVVEPYQRGSTSLEFTESYDANLKAKVQAYKDAGVWDIIAGFETEEITTRITHEQFKKFTKYLRDQWPEKRILACTSPYEIEGRTIGSFVIEPMDYESFAYVTDIGFDMYHTADYAEHEALLKDMKQKLGRKDVRIWFFPCTYKYWDSTSEDYMIKSLDIAYDLLMKEENPGGIYMYTWQTYGSPGLDNLLDPNGEYKYTRLANRIIEIGKEILANDYVYDKPLN